MAVFLRVFVMLIAQPVDHRYLPRNLRSIEFRKANKARSQRLFMAFADILNKRAHFVQQVLGLGKDAHGV